MSSSVIPVDNRPLVAIFWDIENCPIPHGYLVKEVLTRIKQEVRLLVDTIGGGGGSGIVNGHRYRLHQIYVACQQSILSNSKLRALFVRDNDSAPIDVLSVPTGKDNADDKLKDKIRRFVADTNNSQSSSVAVDRHVVLISGDGGFEPELTRALVAATGRRRLRVWVLCWHQRNCSRLLMTNPRFGFKQLTFEPNPPSQQQSSSSSVPPLPISKQPVAVNGNQKIGYSFGGRGGGGDSVHWTTTTRPTVRQQPQQREQQPREQSFADTCCHIICCCFS